MSGAVNKSQIEFPLYGRIEFTAYWAVCMENSLKTLHTAHSERMINELWEFFFSFAIILVWQFPLYFRPLTPGRFNRLNNRPNQFIAFDESFSMQTDFGSEKKENVKFMAFIRLEGFRFHSVILLMRTESIYMVYILVVKTYKMQTTLLPYIEI